MTTSPKEAQEMPEKLYANYSPCGMLGGWAANEYQQEGDVPYIPEAKLKTALAALQKIEWETRGITLAETLNRIATESLRELGEL